MSDDELLKTRARAALAQRAEPEPVRSYLRNCVVTVGNNIDDWLFFADDKGQVFCRLDGYEIKPRTDAAPPPAPQDAQPEPLSDGQIRNIILDCVLDGTLPSNDMIPFARAIERAVTERLRGQP